LPSFQEDLYEGYTTFTWTGTDPVPSATCGGITPVSSTYTGTIQNKGDDYAPTSSWKNVTGESGSTSITKQPHDQPASETTTAVGFSSGTLAIVGQFRQTQNASSCSTDIFKGRQVSETTGLGSPHYDNCYFTGSLVPQWNTVDGSLWNVGYYEVEPPFIYSLNEWVDDYIGYNTSQVSYYRSHHSPASPVCGARIPQVMSIAYYGNSGDATDPYSYDTVGEDIYTSSVTAYRAGVSQTTNH
jgi:hypothetical protein